MDVERKENATEQKRLFGTQLVYGDKVQVSVVVLLLLNHHPPLSRPQLCHTLTGKYVRVNSTLTSRTENTSLRVELTGENSNSCIFKILPRYKVRSVGDVVSAGVIVCVIVCVHWSVCCRSATMTRSNLRVS